jgi:Ca2+-binding RTX toxin-like protein
MTCTRQRVIAGLGALSTALALTALNSPAASAAVVAGSATDIANAIAAPGLVTGATWLTLPPSGTPNGVSNSPLGAFPGSGDTFGILTSGNASFADDPNASGATSANLGGGTVRGTSDLDVSILKLDVLVPQGRNCLRFDFQFLSEEFPEYVGSSFNDAFIAELDTTTWTTSGSSISAPDNFAFDPAGDVVSINASGVTSMTPAAASGTTYDGATPLLTAAKAAAPGAHSLYLSIFDQGDHALDSAVFLDNLEAISSPACAAGATQFEEESSSSEQPGGTLGTDDEGDGASQADPIETFLTVQTAGVYQIGEDGQADYPGLPSTGYQYFPMQVVLAGPAATAADPHVIVFTIDSSQLPANFNPSSFSVFRDGVPVPNCAGGTSAASPDPCVASRTLVNGDLQVVVRTSQFSTWNFGIQNAPVVVSTCAGHTATITGSGVINGTSGSDIIVGSAGADTIRGGGGYDIICGLGGNDTLYGEGGTDVLYGGDGNDTVEGGDGNDAGYGDAGDDQVLGQGGRDYLSGGADTDTVNGGADVDYVYGGAGNDSVLGEAGDDQLFGEAGDDALNGGAGTDKCRGGKPGTDTATACESTTEVP